MRSTERPLACRTRLVVRPREWIAPVHAAFETARTLTVKRLSALVQTRLDIGRSLSVMGLLLLLSLLGTFSLPSVVAEDPALNWQSAAPGTTASFATMSNDLVVRASALEQGTRWSDAVALYESASRSAPLSPEYQRRLDVARIHCDIQRRYNESAFRSQLAHLPEADARRLYGDVLARIGTHHVDVPDFHRLFSRGCLAMETAVQDPAFAATFVTSREQSRYDLFAEQLEQIRSARPVATFSEAQSAASWVARCANTSLGIPPSVTLMEMTAAAVGGLDEYSAFLTGGQLNDLYSQIEGNFVGLGVELKKATDGLLVQHVITGSPAERSGVHSGDHLVGIGGRSIGGMSVDEAAELLQGPEGSLVTLAIVRGVGPARALSVRREHVEVPSVENIQILDATSGVGYLRISSFQKTTVRDLENALRKLDAAGMRAMVVDLRGNPGGLLTSGVDVADLFIERGLVVATRGRSPDEDFNYTASRPGTWKMPLVVVIDGESASASEIFAGAIRDHGRGTIVGTRSYGKGSVQGIFPLEFAGVGIRLTTAKFFSPLGHPYSRVGVEPDLAITTTAKPIDGSLPDVGLHRLDPRQDPFVSAALEVAKRNVVQSTSASTPEKHTTAGR